MGIPKGADRGRGMVARFRLRLWLLVLLLPTQIYSNQTTVVTISSNSSQNTSTTQIQLMPPNRMATGGALSSTAILFVISFSLLHLYCLKIQTKKHLYIPIF
ncbi:PREDICTED: signal transducer CD24-like [Odobenus rosmarus divergens]|uniref:Signal transducer CD24-like n=1 Tax=Odobenus rosmarus divergens TaxID=9708 RepID=A0A9B0LSE0_ODORO